MVATPRKKRARLPPTFVMTTVVAAVAMIVGLPSAAGFGLSAGGATSCAGVRAAADGAMFTRGLSSCSDFSGTERSWRQEAERTRREGERGGGGGGAGTGGRRRGAHAITCRVASPRKYGSAVGNVSPYERKLRCLLFVVFANTHHAQQQYVVNRVYRQYS